jgi:hypothetical protein
MISSFDSCIYCISSVVLVNILAKPLLEIGFKIEDQVYFSLKYYPIAESYASFKIMYFRALISSIQRFLVRLRV